MISLENWAWAEWQLRNIAKGIQQFNLLSDKRQTEREKEKEKKEEKGGKRKLEGVENSIWKRERKEKIEKQR